MNYCDYLFFKLNCGFIFQSGLVTNSHRSGDLRQSGPVWNLRQFEGAEVLTRNQLKNVLGGSGNRN
jgi:hypothetical protein